MASPSPAHHRSASIPIPHSDEESTSAHELAVPPPEHAAAASSPLVAGSHVLHLPTRWSDQDRHVSLSVSGNGRDLNYHGPMSHGDKDAAAARTNHPIPAACGIYYYEVEILNKGAKGCVQDVDDVSALPLTMLCLLQTH
jgi:hypothetical protein